MALRGRPLRLLEAATALVERVPAKARGDWVRCHELTRAVGMILGLPWVDGRFALVEHSWLVVPDGARRPRLLLDVYAVGALPQVQLCDEGWPMSGAREYRVGPAREDIDDRVVMWLCRRMLGETLRAPARRRILIGEIP